MSTIREYEKEVIVPTPIEILFKFRIYVTVDIRTN